MTEGQREEFCSDEARQPRSASVTRAELIVESGSTETNEGPRVHGVQADDTKKSMYLNRV